MTKLVKSKSAQAAEFFRDLGKKHGVKLAAFALMACVMALGAVHPAMAQTATSYGLGANGAPADSDYLSAGQGFAGGIAPILKALLPLLLGMLAVWQGPRIIKALVQHFSHA